MNKEFVYIIPLHKKDKRVFRAIASIPNESTIIIVTSSAIKKWLKGHDDIDVVTDILENKNTSYPALVNVGIAGSKLYNPKFISILEFDDTVTPNAHRIVEEYAEAYPEDGIFAPLSCIVKENEKEGEEEVPPTLVAISNEACFAPGVSEEMGIVDYNMMLRTNFVFINGCYIKPEVFEEFGEFKEAFDIFYDYEWILRMSYNGVIIRGIPKVSRFHYLYDDSIFEKMKIIDQDTRSKWLNLTRREYFFGPNEGREISIT